jgi:hypothetical protein
MVRSSGRATTFESLLLFVPAPEAGAIANIMSATAQCIWLIMFPPKNAIVVFSSG